MKRLVIILVLGLLMLSSMSFAQSESEFNNEQLTLRTELFKFLKEEGFMPEIDSDGDVKFKYEGQIHYFCVSKRDTNPMYVILYRPFNYSEDFDVNTLTIATKELNLYKGVKVVCFENSFRIGAELFVRDSESVKSVFLHLLNVIDDVTSDVLEECEKVRNSSFTSGFSLPQPISEIPFIITKLEVANVDYDGNIIQDYGSIIYDYKSRYLKPRITIKPIKTSGSYTIYVKLYKDNVLQRNVSSSPEDCTFSNDITISGSSNQTFQLSGWGANTAGNWSVGAYRYEVWYNDYCLGSCKFKIY